ncbi:hypothetical protein DXG01_001586 [Tephrocybe rancida]|nr:hypothetical protein DXG01_001586 [Tephrocybe rancida]
MTSPSTPYPSSKIQEILAICPKFRILVVGRSGVGKSSLVSAIFGVDKKDIDIQHDRAGKVDIAHEYTSKNNPRFILHDSEGFEAGSTEKWDTVKNFIQEKCDEKLPLKERIHAIWLCIETPRTGMRLMQTADEQLLTLASKLKIAVIVVFTKYDLLFTEYFRKAGGKGADYSIIDTNAKSHLKQLVEDHKQKFKYATVSTHTKKYIGLSNTFRRHRKTDESYTRAMLTNAIDITQESLLAPESSLSLAVAQRIDVNQKVKYSIELGLEHYWRDLGTCAVFRGHLLENCLSRIHLDIIGTWNFNDPNEVSSDKDFCALLYMMIPFKLLQPEKDFYKGMIDLLQPFLGSKASLFKLYQESNPQTTLCLEAYIVDLLLVLYGLFVNTLSMELPRSLNDKIVPESLKAYRDGKSKDVHQILRETTPSGFALAIRGPLASKKIKKSIAEIVHEQLDRA